MTPYRRLGDVLNPRPRPTPPESEPLSATSSVPMDESAHRHRNWTAVECPGCHGRGAPACSVCHGLGAVCPTCRGAGWVLDARIPVGQSNRLMRCPACNGSVVQAAVIVRGVLT